MGFGSETGDISTPRKAGFPLLQKVGKLSERSVFKKAFVKQPRQLALQQLSVLWQHVTDKWGVDVGCYHGSALNYLAFCNLSYGLQAMCVSEPIEALEKDWHLYLMLFFLYLYSQLGAVRYVPWVKQHINYTGRALIISAASVAAFFITADKTILECGKRNTTYDKPV
ncbi:hypothetical protein CK203_045167 [Vitis vinifera]|uniref:Uncharacterized protein n=1 Tax=Vitis vinifera TaxID=29760 RepID=A0A438H443_VITVI|nr:hypothetical protein CK203_045167 [Vitis vinifera]